jgi:predicted acetyltransferase
LTAAVGGRPREKDMSISTNIKGARLVEASEDLRPQLVAMAEEYEAAGDARYREILEDFEGYLRGLARYSAGVGLPPGHVPSSNFFLVHDGEVVGRGALRHRLAGRAVSHRSGKLISQYWIEL